MLAHVRVCTINFQIIFKLIFGGVKKPSHILSLNVVITQWYQRETINTGPRTRGPKEWGPNDLALLLLSFLDRNAA